MVIVKVIGEPVQPASIGVATKLPDRAIALVLVPVNDAISPDPEAPSPIAVFEFVQFIVAPTGFETKLIAAVFAPAQIV